MTRPAALDTLTFNPIEETDLIGNLAIRDLNVDVSTDTWFIAYRAQAQLAGELVVNKSGEDMPITGTLSGNRGQYTLLAGPVVRRFDIVSAQVRFRGEPSPNPTIDITARRMVLDQSGRQLDVDVRITGTAESPTLQLAGGQTGQIAESELLSFLLFEEEYTRELIDLGYNDAMRIKDELRDFISGADVPRLFAPAWVRKDLSGFDIFEPTPVPEPARAL